MPMAPREMDLAMGEEPRNRCIVDLLTHRHSSVHVSVCIIYILVCELTNLEPNHIGYCLTANISLDSV